MAAHATPTQDLVSVIRQYIDAFQQGRRKRTRIAKGDSEVRKSAAKSGYTLYRIGTKSPAGQQDQNHW
jgi:hypothetical protein